MEDITNEEASKILKDIGRKIETFTYVSRSRFPQYKNPHIDLNAVYKNFPDPVKFKEKVLAMIKDGISLFSVDLKNLKEISHALLDIYDPQTDYDYEFLTECPCGYINGEADVYLTELSNKLTAIADAEWEYLKKYWIGRKVNVQIP